MRCKTRFSNKSTIHPCTTTTQHQLTTTTIITTHNNPYTKSMQNKTQNQQKIKPKINRKSMKNQLKPIYERPKINHQWKNINPNSNHHSPAYSVASEYGPNSVAIATYRDQWRYENEIRGNLCVSVWVLDERKPRREREREREWVREMRDLRD